jgi:hypothetical protein
LESGNVAKARVCLKEGTVLLINWQKLIKLADKSEHGWATIREYVILCIWQSNRQIVSHSWSSTLNQMLVKKSVKYTSIWELFCKFFMVRFLFLRFVTDNMKYNNNINELYKLTKYKQLGRIQDFVKGEGEI